MYTCPGSNVPLIAHGWHALARTVWFGAPLRHMRVFLLVVRRKDKTHTACALRTMRTTTFVAAFYRVTLPACTQPAPPRLLPPRTLPPHTRFCTFLRCHHHHYFLPALPVVVVRVTRTVSRVLLPACAHAATAHTRTPRTYARRAHTACAARTTLLPSAHAHLVWLGLGFSLGQFYAHCGAGWMDSHLTAFSPTLSHTLHSPSHLGLHFLPNHFLICLPTSSLFFYLYQVEVFWVSCLLPPALP